MGAILRLLLEHRESITKIADLAAKIAKAETLTEQVTLSIELLKLASAISATDLDDQAVQFLETVAGTELFAMLIAMIERSLADEPLFGAEDDFAAINPATIAALIEVVNTIVALLKLLRS